MLPVIRKKLLSLELANGNLSFLIQNDDTCLSILQEHKEDNSSCIDQHIRLILYSQEIQTSINDLIKNALNKHLENQKFNFLTSITK